MSSTAARATISSRTSAQRQQHFSILNADALFQLDGGTGFDTLAADFSNQTAAIVWNSAAPTDITFADGAYARNFERLRYFASGSGNDSITQLGRYDNFFHIGAGNDIIAPGLGMDTVDGGPGDDLLVLDFTIGDSPTYTGVFGGGSANDFRRDDPATASLVVDYLVYTGLERLHLIGTPRADTIEDFSGDDIIFGGAGNDVITSPLGGNNSFDGGEGNDTRQPGCWARRSTSPKRSGLRGAMISSALPQVARIRWNASSTGSSSPRSVDAAMITGRSEEMRK